MKRATRNSAIALAVASGAIAVAGPAHADSAANGTATGSPGLISGNTVQLPVHIPVNICGNTIDVTGLLNPAIGNTCTNHDHTTDTRAPSGTTATGRTQDSPGAISGNALQLPVQLPLNVSGNTANLAGAGNPVLANDSTNSTDAPDNQPGQPTHTTHPARTAPSTHPAPHQPSTPHTTPNTPHTSTHQQTGSSLAQTGTDGTWTAAAASITALIGGATLYRRFRPPTTR
jgi:LPXTG-motif cell wall-anchored protein